MGYTPRSTVYTLDFTGTEHEGLEVEMRASKLGPLFDAPELLGIMSRAAEPGAMPSASDIAMGLAKYEEIAEHLVSWNIEDGKGNPVPANLDGLKTQELPLIRLINDVWQLSMGALAPPLSNGSSSGASEPDLTGIPMTTIPASLLSSSTPS